MLDREEKKKRKQKNVFLSSTSNKKEKVSKGAEEIRRSDFHKSVPSDKIRHPRFRSRRSLFSGHSGPKFGVYPLVYAKPKK